MTPQRSPNRWSCLPTAFAMALYTSVHEVIAKAGHDGSEIAWPQFPEPLCRRGFHIQEMIFIAWRHYSRTVTPFEALPMLRSCDGDPIDVPSLPEPHWRMPEVMANASGVVTGTTINGQPHAVAWDGEIILDPNGTTYSIDKFRLECFWMLK
jgi:hypothetical protein